MLASAAACLLALPSALWAQTPPQAQAQAQADAAPPPSTGWTANLGVGAISAPRYPGAAHNRLVPIPAFELRYRDAFFIDPLRGMGVELPLGGGFSGSAGVAIDYSQRRHDDGPRARRLREIPEQAALHLELDYELGRFFVESALSARIGRQERRGTVVDTDVGFNVVHSGNALVGVGVTSRVVDSVYARNFFGIDARQSAASGLPVYGASGGLASVGPFAQAAYRFGDGWAAFGRLGVSRLRGEIAASPVVASRSQPFLLVTLTKSFR